MIKHISKFKGFTLIEMLLVIVIIGMVLILGLGYYQQRALNMRIDRTTLQMQQILNASLAYYVTHGSWPSGTGTPPDPLQTLYTSGFLPIQPPIMSPWGTPYVLDTTTSKSLVYVSVQIQTGASSTSIATVVAGTLPLAFTSANATVPLTPPPTPCLTGATSCYVFASMNIPAQNLNNASAFNYGGIVRNGGCIPAPSCPVDANGNTMTPEVMVIPVSVTGAADQSNPSAAFPISSFTAYVTPQHSGPIANPPPCLTNPSGDSTCYQDQSGGSVALASPPNYWRACLEVVTEKGVVKWTNSNTDNSGQFANILAITRCSIQNENAHTSSFNVFTQ